VGYLEFKYPDDVMEALIVSAAARRIVANNIASDKKDST
jgi:hypothetical protein